MFIISKNRFLIPRDGADPYVIPKDYIGEIPEDVAGHWLLAAAIGCRKGRKGRHSPRYAGKCGRSGSGR